MWKDKRPRIQRFKNVEIVRGDNNLHTYGIEQSLADNGPWYLLLRAHDHIWNNRGWPFDVRWEASHLLWEIDSTFFVGVP